MTDENTDDDTQPNEQERTEDAPEPEREPVGYADDDESIQERVEAAMPDFPEDRREMPDGDEFRMTTDEQRELTDLFDGLIHSLYDRGFTPNELSAIVRGFAHRMNASRYDPHEYDRIALTIRLREEIETWREEQDAEVPEVEVAETVEELGRVYRANAREEVYRNLEPKDG